MYHLMVRDNKKVQVCKKMFLNTLVLKEQMTRTWFDQKKSFGTMKSPMVIKKRVQNKLS